MSLTTFLKPLPSTRLTLRPDQEEAISRIVDELQFSDRTQAVMACGTGKTVTAQRAAERIVEGKTDPTVLIAVPNLVLVDQMISDWRSQMLPGQEFAILPVNSRTTKRRRADDDDFVVDIEGVTDDPEIIAAFLAGAGRKLIVTTYQSMQHISDALVLVRKRTPGFELDLIISDEAHRTAGQLKADQKSPFKIILDNEAVPAAKRVFMTATPRISKLNATGNGSPAAASMDNPEAYGDRAVTRSLRWAVDQKLLAPYRAYVIQITDGDLQDVIEQNPTLRVDGDAAEARLIASAISLAKSAAANNLGGIVTYHSRIESAQDFTRILRAVVDALPTGEKPSGELTVSHINGSTPADERSRILDTLDSSTRKPGDWSVVTNCSCLTEGVNVPSMDAIMFVDPRRSVVANVQAIGRPMRRDPNNPAKVASILLPVFVGTVDSPEQALEEGAFSGVFQVIKSLKDVDDALSEMFVDALVAKPEDYVGGESSINDLLSVSGEANDDAALIQLSAYSAQRNPVFWRQWHEALRLKVLEESTDWWEKGLAALKAYVEREGHARVPSGHVENGINLGTWVAARRANKDALTTEQRGTLEGLTEWFWAVLPGTWEKHFEALQAYVKREGTAVVPGGHLEDGLNLSRWITRQRSKYHQNLSDDKRSRLEALPGWTWGTSNSKTDWADWMALLHQFTAREGHARVPSGHIEGTLNLGSWVANTRAVHKKGQLSEERAAQLDQVPGWVWDTNDLRFSASIQAAKACVERGIALGALPLNHKEDGHGTGKWLSDMRSRLVQGKLSKDQITKLDAVDPSWRKGRKSPWEIEQELLTAA